MLTLAWTMLDSRVPHVPILLTGIPLPLAVGSQLPTPSARLLKPQLFSHLVGTWLGVFLRWWLTLRYHQMIVRGPAFILRSAVIASLVAVFNFCIVAYGNLFYV